MNIEDQENQNGGVSNRQSEEQKPQKHINQQRDTKLVTLQENGGNQLTSNKDKKYENYESEELKKKLKF